MGRLRLAHQEEGSKGEPYWASASFNNQDVSIFLLRRSVSHAVRRTLSGLCKPFCQSLWQQAPGGAMLWASPRKDLHVPVHWGRTADAEAEEGGGERNQEESGSRVPAPGRQCGAPTMPCVLPRAQCAPYQRKGRLSFMLVKQILGYNSSILLKWPVDYMMKLSRKRPVKTRGAAQIASQEL